MRFIRWISLLIIHVMLISILTFTTTLYMVDRYTASFFDRLNLNEGETSLSLLDYASFLSQQFGGVIDPNDELEEKKDNHGQELIDKVQDQNHSEVANNDPNGNISGSTNGEQKQNNLSPTTDNLAGATNEEHDVPAFVQDKETGTVMSVEEFNQKKDQLSDADKMEIFSLLISKIPQEEMQKMSVYLEDGINQDELQEVEKLITKYLEKEEYDKLLTIINKY